MLIDIYEKFRELIEANVPAGVKVGYGSLDTIKRKIMNCKGTANLPIFGITVGSAGELQDEFNLPALIEGYPSDGNVGTPEEGLAVQWLPLDMEIACFYLSNDMSDILTFSENIMFLNYEPNGQLMLDH